MAASETVEAVVTRLAGTFGRLSRIVAAMGELQGIAAGLRETAQVLKTDVDRFTVGAEDES
jgi:hypothetical protein